MPMRTDLLQKRQRRSFNCGTLRAHPLINWISLMKKTLPIIAIATAAVDTNKAIGSVDMDKAKAALMLK